MLFYSGVMHFSTHEYESYWNFPSKPFSHRRQEIPISNFLIKCFSVWGHEICTSFLVKHFPLCGHEIS